MRLAVADNLMIQDSPLVCFTTRCTPLGQLRLESWENRVQNRFSETSNQLSRLEHNPKCIYGCSLNVVDV